MTTAHLPRLPGTPEAEQARAWIGEAQQPDGAWRLVAGPGLRREVSRAVRSYRASQGHLATETRVRLP